jgi:putative two-component system response regulator
MELQHKVLVVDDEPANLRLLQRVLNDEYEVLPAGSGQEALDLLKSQDISLIITDQRMPVMSGVQLLQQSLGIRPDAIKILLTGYTDVQSLIDAINSGHVYKYIPKPWDADELKLTVRRALETFELKRRNESLVRDLKNALVELEDLSMSTIAALADALDAKCDYTSGHSLRVSRYALAIGRAIGLPDDEMKNLEIAGILHDVGKIGVPESILWKPAKLSPEEQAIMAQHPVRSAQIIGDIPVLRQAREWVLHHHEYMDGSGYPHQLVGEKIPHGARIILVADAYDAMTTDRPYRKAIGHERASVELRKYAGKQFDGQMVEALLASVGESGENLNDGIPESFLGLKLNTIDPLQLGRHYQAESERQGRLSDPSGSR